LGFSLPNLRVHTPLDVAVGVVAVLGLMLPPLLFIYLFPLFLMVLFFLWHFSDLSLLFLSVLLLVIASTVRRINIFRF
jgi:hypothetical protein